LSALLKIQNLEVQAHLAGHSQVILDGFDLDVRAAEVIGVVGESGSGKTTLVRSLVGLLDKNVKVTDGDVSFNGRRVLTPQVDETRGLRGRHIGMVFQDATRSLDPLFKVGTQIREVLNAHSGNLPRDEAEERMKTVLRRMQITDPERVLRSYPHHLSGGLCQRVAIALAIVTSPQVVLADECTTALDVTTQAEVVALLRELVTESGIALVFVTHNLMLASELCDRIVVMYAGQAVELGPAEHVLTAPHHPYSAGLLASIPSWDRTRPIRGIEGSAPRITTETTGCRFADRCPLVMDACRADNVDWRVAPDGGGYRCIAPLNLPS
jgi:oligopeptide/dipeptide ABC transporter ATP-binding protein